MFFIEGIFWISLLIYGMTFIFFCFGNLYSTTYKKTSSTQSVTVIVAVKNGVNSLNQLLKLLARQVYSGDLEFIIVDDNPVDETAEIINHMSTSDARFRYISSVKGSANLSHKKRALDAGIAAATGEMLLFTDVDCRMGPLWVQAMSNTLIPDVDFVIGYSRVKPTKSLVSRFQSLDFFQLMAGARGITSIGYPWASTGQNQAYRKNVFEKAGGFSSIAGCLQGDDSLFLQVARKKLKIKVRFSDDTAAFVTGRTEHHWGDLIRQRIRWAGDANLMWQFNPIFFLVLGATFVSNLSLLVFFMITLFSGHYLTLFFSGLALKLILEFMLYGLASKPLHQKFDSVDFFFWFFLQIPYIVLMGITSFLAPRLGWKERT